MTWAPLLIACAAFAQEPSVEVAAATSSARLGSPVVLAATARLPAGGSISLDLARSATDSFLITKVEDEGRRSSSRGQTESFRLEILPLAVGKLPVALAWTFSSPQGDTELQSPAVLLDVQEPPIPGAGEILDIKAPRPARPRLWPWLLAAALAWAAYELARRRRRDAGPAASHSPAVDERPAEMIAGEALAGLEASELWGAGKFKEFYVRLTDILRQYVERRYAVPATRLTTVELARHLRRAELERLVSVMFHELFDRADLVKFAKATPAPEWGERDLEAARRIVAATTPKENELAAREIRA